MRRFALKLATIAWLLLVYSIFVGTFLVAYANPDKAVRVTIDSYGEAHVELVLLALGALVIIPGTALLAADAFRSLREEFERRARQELAGL